MKLYIKTTFTRSDCHSFYAYVERQEEKLRLEKRLNKIFDTISISSIIMLGCVNPLYGIVFKGCLSIMANEEVKNKMINKICEKWDNLPILTKQAIILGVGLSVATTIVLVTSIIFNQDRGRDGLSPEALSGGPKFFRLKGEIRPSIGAEFCDHVVNYASKYRYSSDFVPPNPFEVDYGAINKAILKISEQINNKQPIKMTQTALFVLLHMCTKTTF